MATVGDGQLACDRGEDSLDLLAEFEQDRYGHDRDESQDQGIFNEGLALFLNSITTKVHNTIFIGPVYSYLSLF
jgi:hypothetical protein